MKEQIKAYWEKRAEHFLADPASTTHDVYLRELEIMTIAKVLRALLGSGPAKVLDVGCGDGYATLNVARKLPEFTFAGIDYSANMIRLAKERLAGLPSLTRRLTFKVGDVLDLGAACGETIFDAVISDRCLINLADKADQEHAIKEIARHVAPGGYYLAVENFEEGQAAMNQARIAVGLPEIPVRWHNLYFSEAEFTLFAEPEFEFLEFKDFSSAYYFATRVIYTALCRKTGEEIDYRHPLHELAVELPWTGNFSPIRMAVLRRRSA
uniref:Methyltransferase domain-containing protein n=1 Tax=Desulfobacca acetoxidans TaxID=60893 RepID=A0A7V6DNW2_9BACT